MHYLVIASIALIISFMVIGSTLLEDSERYVMILGDDNTSPNDIYLEFYEINSKNDREVNRQVIVDEGFFLLDEKEYSLIDDWKGSFLDNDELFFMTGNVESFDEKIDIFLMGKFLQKTIDGSLYEITVHIHSESPIEFQTIVEIIGIVPRENTQEIQPETPIDLLFLIKDTHHRFQNQDYVFTAKLYDKKQNPSGEWNSKGGVISGAEIIVQAIDLKGNLLREIKGNTNEFGWFEGKFPTGMMFPRGEYLVLYTAKYQNNIAGFQKPLYVFEVKTDANYRHFTPTSDIDRGKWKDDFGNGNDLMFDDLDEYPQDHLDYVRSRQLGTSTPDDTLHLKMNTYAGVTADHSHIISYTLRKDSSGGNNIAFTVTLFDGTNPIAQWIHLDVDENFRLITNILTLEQMRKISSYNNLSLEFVVECTTCDLNKRNGQISWVHMVV
ncbi:MAG: hypothetical protein K5777_06425 [Nitrosopumilus sp.]|nr:hypothetical protein [Nitrosopumilus sp.]